MAEDGTAKAGHNGQFDPDKVQGFVSRIETLHGDLASEKGTYMQACKTIREDMKGIYDEAKDAGIPKKALKSVIKARDLEKRATAAREDLEGDDQDAFDNIRHALGDLADLPLGQAAVTSLEEKRASRKAKAEATA